MYFVPCDNKLTNTWKSKQYTYKFTSLHDPTNTFFSLTVLYKVCAALRIGLHLGTKTFVLKKVLEYLEQILWHLCCKIAKKFVLWQWKWHKGCFKISCKKREKKNWHWWAKSCSLTLLVMSLCSQVKALSLLHLKRK